MPCFSEVREKMSDELTGGSKRFCEGCADDTHDHYTVNDVTGTECDSCGTTISFGERAFYVST